MTFSHLVARGFVVVMIVGCVIDNFRTNVEVSDTDTRGKSIRRLRELGGA